MNITDSYFTQSIPLTALIVSFCMSLQGTCQNDTADVQLKELSARVVQTHTPIPDATINEIASNLSLILPGISFEPDYNTSPNFIEITPNGVIAIKEATKIAITILKSNSLQDGIEKNIESFPLKTFDSFLLKLNRSIDPHWEFLSVTSNVIPPPGTPNASAGMNPEAIADLNLRHEYLDLIEKNRHYNLKNGQQRALLDARNSVLRTIADLVSLRGGEWKKAEVISHFCKDDNSKIILEKYIQLRN